MHQQLSSTVDSVRLFGLVISRATMKIVGLFPYIQKSVDIS